MKRRQRKTQDEDLDITPMIDVTFLLLIFFMVASTMQSSTDLALPPATHGEGVVDEDAIVISIVSDSGNPTIHLGRNAKAPEGTLESVKTYALKGVQEQRSIVIIRADRDLASGFVEDVAREANVEGIQQMFYGVEQPRN